MILRTLERAAHQMPCATGAVVIAIATCELSASAWSLGVLVGTVGFGLLALVVTPMHIAVALRLVWTIAVFCLGLSVTTPFGGGLLVGLFSVVVLAAALMPKAFLVQLTTVSALEGLTPVFRLCAGAMQRNAGNIYLLRTNEQAWLAMAARFGHIGVIRDLIRRGTSVSNAASNSLPPVTLAALYGHHDVVSELLAHGANPNVSSTEHDGVTPLMAAAQNGSVPTAKILIGAGADVRRQNRHGSTALTFAAFHGHHDVAALLRHDRRAKERSCT